MTHAFRGSPSACGARPTTDAQKLVAKTAHRPYEPRPIRIVLQHLPDFRDQNRQAAIGHERIRPEALVKLGLRERPLVMFGEKFQ